MITSLNIPTQHIILLLAVLFAGLVAGIFFTWANAVTPGIGRLHDINYLSAFQQMNRTILNPSFYIVFTGPLWCSLIAIYMYKAYPPLLLQLLTAAAIIYFLGVVLVTISGNIPLNEVLDKANLAEISAEDARNLRSKFEVPWNTFHLVRTIASTVSFLLLLLTCILRNYIV